MGIMAMREHLDPALVSMPENPGGASADGRPPLPACATAYYTAVNRGNQLTVRNERELRTLALSIDLLINGERDRAADVLMQRYKAVEMASADGHWSVATHLELLAPQMASATSTAEREAASSLELAEGRLRAVQSSRGGKDRGRGQWKENR